MKQKTKQFVAAFLISGIFMVALTGFLVVDLRAGRDLRAQYEPLLRFSSITADGMEVSFLGRHSYFIPELLAPAKELVWKLRALFPAGAQAAAHIFVQLARNT